MRQVGRNLTDAVDGFVLKHRYVIMGPRSVILP